MQFPWRKSPKKLKLFNAQFAGHCALKVFMSMVEKFHFAEDETSVACESVTN